MELMGYCDEDLAAIFAAIGSPPNVTAAQMSTLSSILAGLTRRVEVALTAADTAGGVFAWQNPEAGSILVRGVVIDVTTIATGACALDIGTTATSAATLSDNILDGLDVHTGTGTFDGSSTALLDGTVANGTNGRTVQKLATGKWVTGSKVTGATAGLVGTAIIFYSPL